jgi:hypothetical protein
MKVRVSSRPSLLAGCRVADMKGQPRTPLLSCVLASALLMFHCVAFAAGPVKAPPGDSESQNPAKSYAPIGNSGYRVPIPEINMNRIFGGRPGQPPREGQGHRPVPPASQGPQAPTEETTSGSEAPRVHWLPFDPSRRTPSLRPPRQNETKEEQRQKEEIPSILKPPPAPDQPLEAVPPKKEVLGALPLPQQPTILAAPRAKESPMSKHMEFRDAAELTGTLASIPLGTRQVPARVAMPEPTAEPAPRPDRVIPDPEANLALRQPPDVMAAPRVKESPKPKHQGFHDAEEPPGSVTSIPLGTRQEPATVAVPQLEAKPVPRAEHVAVPAPETNPALRQPPEVLAAPRVKESPESKHQGFHDAGEAPGAVTSIPLGTRREPAALAQPEPEPTPELRQEPAAIPEPESKPAPEQTQPSGPAPAETVVAQPPEPIEMKPPAEESGPPKEQPIVPAKEALISPLASAGPQNVELQHYLRDTAPILEELSLLMTRAPSLAVADYDPSQDHPATIRDDIYMKIEYMKRELQVLDSKTFAIIPPPKYAAFHSVIRDSITETYQACDTIITYMRSPTSQNLQKMQEHLRRARELIQMTRTGRG